jgi:tRNA dimethylallyltransferase
LAAAQGNEYLGKQKTIAAVSREAPVLIAGPTASGKSALAMDLAARDGRVVVNADALQVYADWRVLTARPSPADEAAVPHALFGHVGWDQTYSVGHWLTEVQVLLDRPVVIVGGTGLYFMALTEGLVAIPPVPADVRALGDSLSRDVMLQQLDPDTRGRIDVMNRARVQRAWEVLRATGRGLAAWQAETGAPVLPVGKAEALVLRPDVTVLNARIDARFDAMMDQGALQEVRAILPRWDAALPAARAIGAAELVAHLQGNLPLADAIAAAKRATRQYAKRQRTWLRRRMAGWQEIA